MAIFLLLAAKPAPLTFNTWPPACSCSMVTLVSGSFTTEDQTLPGSPLISQQPSP